MRYLFCEVLLSITLALVLYEILLASGFARRLAQLKKPVQLEVFNKLPHGFLNFSVFSPEAAEATEITAQRIAQVLGMTPKPPLV